VHTWDHLKDGRLVCSSEFDNVQSGTSNLSIGTEDELPTGIYTVCIEGFGPETITRRVVLLDE